MVSRKKRRNLPRLSRPYRACIQRKSDKNKKGISTRDSRAVPHPSTNRALNRLTSEFGWDPVHLTEYGR